jgi:ankyrin repeat protein
LNALKWISSRDTKVDIEFKAEEKSSIEGRALRKEVTGYTPLMLAIMGGNTNLMLIKYLVDTLRCNIRAKDNFGNTVIHLAVKYGCEELVKYFVIEKKMEAFDRNFEGKTAVIIAHEKGLANIESIFAQLDGSAIKVTLIYTAIDSRTNQSK